VSNKSRGAVREVKIDYTLHFSSPSGNRTQSLCVPTFRYIVCTRTAGIQTEDCMFEGLCGVEWEVGE
jgi:hypothetical protein